MLSVIYKAICKRTRSAIGYHIHIYQTNGLLEDNNYNTMCERTLNIGVCDRIFQRIIYNFQHNLHLKQNLLFNLATETTFETTLLFNLAIGN